MGKKIDTGFLPLYRLDKFACDRGSWDFSARLVSNCSGILLPQINLTLAYRKQSWDDCYIMSFFSDVPDKEYALLHGTKETIRNMFEKICANMVSKLKHVKVIYDYPNRYKEVIGKKDEFKYMVGGLI